MFKKLREPMNGLTHFVGVIFAICATILMITGSLNPYRADYVFSYSVYGLGLLLLYTSSTLYHWLNLSPEGIQKMRKVDHIMIFVLIAATYTPICMIPLKGALGWTVLAVLWTITILGTFFKIYWITAPRWLSTSIYLGMAWMAVLIIIPLIRTLNPESIIWLAAGGVFYTIGAIIYGMKKPDPLPGVLGFHEIFHLFVLAGSVCHFWFMYKYIGNFA
jgi:hemolysin III